MPRKARIISENGIYHVILRGINRQQIFEDREDFEKSEQSKQSYSISKFKQQGLSIRPISRLTGVSFNIVRKY